MAAADYTSDIEKNGASSEVRVFTVSGASAISHNNHSSFPFAVEVIGIVLVLIIAGEREIDVIF